MKALHPLAPPNKGFSQRLIAAGLAAILFGCSTVGPASISSGRQAYNEAIRETNNQQILIVPVHNRYGESNHLLAVSSVTANVSTKSSAAIQAGFGDVDDYSGNLVPFSGGFIYEENPTISYTPVAGEAYLDQLSSPVPIHLFAKIVRSEPYPQFAYNMLLSSINGIQNPAFLFDSQQDDPRFERLVELMIDLGRAYSLHWVEDSRTGKSLSLVIHPLGAEQLLQAQELMDLLGLVKPAEVRPASVGERLVVPVSLAEAGGQSHGIAINTRSIWQLVEILSAAVEVPPQDEGEGIVVAFPSPGRAGRDLAVRYSESRPAAAYVAVEYRDGWFYLERSDLASKRYFKLLGNLWSAAMSRSLGTTSATPVLTVPVSR